MSKYCGPRLRIIRRIGELPAFTRKILKRNTRPGQHGSSRRKPTQFAYRLIEKQKLLFYYGISEKQLVKRVKVARKAKGSTGEILVQQLEIRLDNTIYRIGWAPTLPAARQLVNHGHIVINQKRTNIPSFSCFPGQIINLRDKESSRNLVKNNSRESNRNLPLHISLNIESTTAKVSRFADRNEISLNLNELLIIEYYSNRLLIDTYFFLFSLCPQLFFLLFLYLW